MKKLTLIITLLSFSTCENLFSQSTFVKEAGVNGRAIYPQASALTPDSSIVEVGFDDNGNSDLIKFNRYGMAEWAIYLTAFNSYLESVQQFHRKMYVGGSVGNDAYILSINSSGQKIWSTGIHYPSSSSSVITGIASGSNNLYLSGTALLTNQSYVPFLIKLDSIGNVIWCKEYGLAGNVNDIVFNESLNQIILLENYRNIISIDTSGNVIWSKTYPSFGLSKIAIQNDSNYVVAGGDSLVAIFSLNENGAILWAKKYNDTANFSNYVTSFYVSPNQDIYFGNISNSASASYPPISIVKLNSAGNVLWGDSYWGNSGPCGIFGITSNFNGDLWLTGEAPFNYQNVFFISRDTSSNPGCIATITHVTDSPFSLQDSIIAVTNQVVSLTSINVQDTLLLLPLNQLFDCPTSIPETEIANEVTAPYPNPASETVTFQFSGEIVNLTVKIYDALGREVHNEKVNDNITVISVADYSSGIYFYRVEQDGVIKASGKFIVE